MATPGQAQFNTSFYHLRAVTGKGLGAFALKDIKAGTRVLVDNALFAINKKYDDINIFDIHAAVLRLDNALRQQFHALPHPLVAVDSKPSLGRTSAIFHLHTFPAGPQDSSWGCFAHAARFNHSCDPNCAFTPTAHGQQQCFVTKDVTKGDELVFAYFEDVQYMTTNERQRFITGRFNRSCLCSLCTLPARERECSDLRRRLMRHVLFGLRGKDLNNAETTILGPNKTRIPGLKTLEAVGLVWPLLLFANLAEADGMRHGACPRMCLVNAIAIEYNRLVRAGHGQIHRKSLESLRGWANRFRELKRNYTGIGTYDYHEIEQNWNEILSDVDRLG